MSGSYDLKRSGEQYMFNLKAGNGQTILTSERYAAKAGASDGIESVRKNSPIDERYQRKVAKDGSPFFTLSSTNGQVIGHSEMYSSVAARDNGIASCKTNGPTAIIKDNTASNG
ncbi:MAG: YegP family protein [Advenella sp.]